MIVKEIKVCFVVDIFCVMYIQFIFYFVVNRVEKDNRVVNWKII